MKQYEAVIQTLENLGGVATLGQLNTEVFKIKDCEWKTKTPFASIRRIVQQTAGIYKIRPGLYGLEKMKSAIESRGIVVESAKNRDSEEVKLFNHSYYQGLLLMVGNLHHLETFVPKQDKNKKFYDGRALGEISSIDDLPPFSYRHIQNSLLKFNDLQDFYARMVIVADGKRKEEFQEKMKYRSFDELRKTRRVTFLSYDALIKQYEQEIERQAFDLIL